MQNTELYQNERIELNQNYRSQHRAPVENFIVNEIDRIEVEAELRRQAQNVPAGVPMEEDQPQVNVNDQIDVPMDVAPQLPNEEPNDEEPNYEALLDDDDLEGIELDPDFDFSDDEEPLNPGGQETLIQHDNQLDPYNVDAGNDQAIEYAPGQHNRPLSLLLDKNVEFMTFAKSYAGTPLRVLNSDGTPNNRVTYSRLSKWEVKHKERRVQIDQLMFKVAKLVAHQTCNAINVCLRQFQGRNRVTAGQVLNNNFLNELFQRNDGKQFNYY